MTVDTDVRGEDTEPPRPHGRPEAERINPPPDAAFFGRSWPRLPARSYLARLI
ncbi:hypothetical protein ACRBEV_01000 [Methylobacterium phyllosphaerae]